MCIQFFFQLFFYFQLSTAPGDKEAIDVWFVMLDRPKLSELFDVQSKRFSFSKRILSISEAYRNLAALISQRDIPLKLALTKDREVVIDGIIFLITYHCSKNNFLLGGTFKKTLSASSSGKRLSIYSPERFISIFKSFIHSRVYGWPWL